MINSLRANNSSFINVANVQVQPAKVDSTTHSVAQQSKAVAVKDIVLPSSLITHNNASATVAPKLSLASLVSSFNNVSNTVSAVKFPLDYGGSYVMPTHALSLDAGRMYDPRVTQGFVTTTTRFQPYEQLTGIAHERPEIIMLTNFEPLFDIDSNYSSQNFINHDDVGVYSHMTDTGRYIDAQIMYRNLSNWNTYTYTRNLRATYSGLNQKFLSRSSDMSAALDRLKSNAGFLLNLVRIIETQKHQLDLRHDTYTVNPSDVINYIVQDHTQQLVSAGSTNAVGLLRRMVTSRLPRKYDCVDSLQMLGYSSDSIKNVFSSTKIWMQILVELKAMLKHHSLPFLDIDPSYQKNDNNPTSILIPQVKYFGFSSNLPDLPTLNELINLEASNVSNTLGLLIPAFSSIYENSFFKNEEARIAGLAHILTQEYRYSHGLSLEPVQRALEKFYGFKVEQNGNTTVFDSIFGNFGNNITDFPSTSDQSLTSLAQNTVGRNSTNAAGILTFETKYVEGDTGTLTPGGDFFFDRVLDTDGTKFNTEAIEALTLETDDQQNQLNIIVDGLNLLALPVQPDKLVGVANITHTGNFLSTAIDAVNNVTSQLINPAGTPLPVALNDRLGAIYSRARNDNRLKSILFLYTMARISRNYSKRVSFFVSRAKADNTPVVDFLVDQLIVELKNTTSETRSAVQLLSNVKTSNTSTLTVDSIKSALKTGTQLTAIIEQFMSEVVAQFRTRTTAIIDGFTRYGGYLDTVVMMAAFDFVISVVARYSNQTIVGTHTGTTGLTKGVLTFVVSQASTNHSLSFNELQQRINAETSRIQQLFLLITNVLKRLSGSLKGITNYLNSTEAKQQLLEIASVLQNNKDMLRMLFSEQQIMLLASTVENLIAAANASASPSSDPKSSYHDDGSVTSQEIVMLDDSDVTPAARNVLYGFLGTSEFASLRSINKRIVTVGIPLGFTQRLKQKVRIQDQKRASFENKRNDIVQVTVYRVDIQNYGIVYKPIKYLFEMSRFPVRNTSSQWLPMSAQPTLAEIVNSIPTQCFTQNLDAGTASSITSGIEYASTASAQTDSLRSTRAAFDDASYNFLSASEKSQILQNHVISQILELYIKLMTGVNIAEYNYHMSDVPAPVDSDFVKSIIDHGIQHVTDQAAAHAATLLPSLSKLVSPGVLFGSNSSKSMPTVEGVYGKAFTSPITSNPSGIAGKITAASQFRDTSTTVVAATSTININQAPEPATTNLAKLSARYTDSVLQNFHLFDNFSNSLSNVSSINAINRRVMVPKQFDRVFNIVVDPRNFEIDVAKTIETPYGKQALDLLLKQGDIISSDSDNESISMRLKGQANVIISENAISGRGFSQGRAQPNINNFRFRERDKTQGDLVADKYFVTIETFGEDEV